MSAKHGWVLGLSLLLAGCGDDAGSPRGPSTAKREITLTCTAFLNATTLPYRLEGRTLFLTDSGQEVGFAAADTNLTPESPVGEWVPPQVAAATQAEADLIAKYQLKMQAILKIEDNRITMTSQCSSVKGNATALASVPAAIYPNTLVIAGSKTDQKIIYRGYENGLSAETIQGLEATQTLPSARVQVSWD
jgi:hypothetical protein